MATRRNPPWYKEADRDYPIRVKFVVPPGGLRTIEQKITLDQWLAAELGPQMWNWGPAGSVAHNQATAYYFRRLEDAQRFVAAFPGLELADGVTAAIDTVPVPRVRAKGHSI